MPRYLFLGMLNTYFECRCNYNGLARATHSVLNSRLSRLSRPTTVPTAISSPRDRLTSIPTKPTACLGRKGGRGGERVRERPERSESSSTLVNSHNLGPRLTHLTTLPGSIELDI